LTHSFLVTVYLLSLGEYDATTGIPAMQYTPASARVLIGEKAVQVLRMLGRYAAADATALTKYDVDEGDIIMDNYDSVNAKYWTVLGRVAITTGNTFAAWQLSLERRERPNFHVLTSALVGFETIDDTHKFEDGFERLYITV
jgi:hypothetical protein